MQFVWAKDLRTEMNVTLAFVWKAGTAHADAMFELCAAQAYRLWLNNKVIGYGPARTAHGCARKDTYALGDLAAGDCVVAEVCAYNVRCLSVAGKHPFFGATVVSGGRAVAESADFACYRLTDRKQKVLRYSFQRAFTESYDMQQCRCGMYRGEWPPFAQLPTESVPSPRILPRRTPYPAMGETILPAPAEQGRVLQKADGVVWRDRAHEITDIFDGFALRELEEDLSAEASRLDFAPDPVAHGGTYAAGAYGIYDLGRTLSGFFRLQLTVHADTVLYILFDEINAATDGHIRVDFKRNDSCNAIKYQLRKGRYDLLSFEPVCARYACLCVTQGEIQCRRFGFVSYENESALQNEYLLPDPALREIMRAAQNTLAQNSVDFLTDCPSRERAGWLADAFFAGRAEYMLTGGNAALYALLENYALSPALPELPRGMLPMCYPGDFPNGDYIPNFAMWFVIVLHDYARRYPSSDLPMLSKQKVYDALDYFARFENEEGLLEDLQGWVFVEWSAANRKDFVRGVNFPSNMTYAAMLRCAGELYNDNALLVKSERLRRKICEHSFNGTFFADNAERDGAGNMVRTDHITETCQYYAFFFGVADRRTHAALYDLIKAKFGYARPQGAYAHVHRSNAFIGFLLRLDLLRKEGEYDTLKEEVKGYYADMARATGTLWEHADVRASLNHGFASYVAVLIAQATGTAELPF